MEVARLALMRRDQAAFRSELGQAQALLLEWFDPDSREVQSVGARLEELLALNVTVAWPDISAPWTMLKRIRSVQAVPVSPVQPAVGGESPEPGSTPDPNPLDDSGEDPQ
jgi:uncharacterized protein HemX